MSEKRFGPSRLIPKDVNNGNTQNNNENTLPPSPAGVATATAPAPQPFVPADLFERQPYTATKTDLVSALSCLGLGFLYFQWMYISMFTGWQGWCVTAFAGVYILVCLLSARFQKIAPPKSSWFWCAILSLVGISYSLWPSGSLFGWRGLMFFCVAVYWAGSLFGVLANKKTSNLLLLDLLNLLFRVPWQNFLLLTRTVYKALKPGKEQKDPAVKKRTGSILLGVAICIPIFVAVVPMLLMADSGGFTTLFRGLNALIADFFYYFSYETFFQCVIAFLVGSWLFGLIGGSTHRRYTTIDAKKVQKELLAYRILPSTTAVVVLGLVTALYLLFIALQLPYYFSAFNEVLPGGYTSYAEYARAGFFELCRVSAINLGLMLAANLLSHTPRAESKALRKMNIALSCVSMLLLITAFSKMALYISTYGLTPKRVLTSVFMVFLAGVYVAVIVLQYKAFSIARFAAVFGSCLFCLLCLVDMDGQINRINADLYLKGGIPAFETVLLQNTGYAGAGAALQIYHGSEDEALRGNIENELWRHYQNALYSGSGRYANLASSHIKALVEEEEFIQTYVFVWYG